MKEINGWACACCGFPFEHEEIVFYTWYENQYYCLVCKSELNEKVDGKYLDWQERKNVIR